MKKRLSIALIGEGETEWFYFESLRVAKRYLGRNNLYQYLCKEGNLSRAMQNSEVLRKLSIERPDEYRSYSEIHEVLKTLEKLTTESD